MSVETTIDDVAAAAGFSRSTVSLVLNERDVVKGETVVAVRRAIDALGYQLAPRGRRRGQRDRKARSANRIALLASGLPRAAMNSPVYMDVLHGIEAAVRKSGKGFMLTHLPPNEPCPMPLFPQKVDGVILFGAAADTRLTKRMNGMPCVRVMGSIDRDGVWDHVTYDNGKVGQIAAAYLLARGHRQAAFICKSRMGFLAERGEAFKRAMQAAGGDSLDLIDELLQDETGPAIRVIPERLATLLDQLFADNTDGHGQTRTDADGYAPSHPSPALAPAPRTRPPHSALALVPSPPTALFLAADTLAPAVCGELQRRGLTPGTDIDVISCNNEQTLLTHLHPRPATIDIHAELLGQKAVEQLLWRIDHPTAPRATTALEPTFRTPYL